jgi:hypothetical protein
MRSKAPVTVMVRLPGLRVGFPVSRGRAAEIVRTRGRRLLSTGFDVTLAVDGERHRFRRAISTKRRYQAVTGEHCARPASGLVDIRDRELSRGTAIARSRDDAVTEDSRAGVRSRAPGSAPGTPGWSHRSQTEGSASPTSRTTRCGLLRVTACWPSSLFARELFPSSTAIASV